MTTVGSQPTKCWPGSCCTFATIILCALLAFDCLFLPPQQKPSLSPKWVSVNFPVQASCSRAGNFEFPRSECKATARSMKRGQIRYLTSPLDSRWHNNFNVTIVYEDRTAGER